MEILSSYAGLITGSLWSVSWQVTILVGIIWIVDRLSRNSSSLFRYWLWCIVLLRLCVPVNVSLPENIGQFINSTIGINAPDINKIILNPAIEMTSSFISLERTVSTNPTLLFDITGFLWLLSVVFISALIIIRIFRIKHLLKDRIPIERPDLLSLVGKNKNEMGIKRSVGIHYSNIDNFEIPAVIGIIKPKILFPRRIADEWTVAEIEPLLLHELAHIKRYDLLVNLLQVIIQVIYFFHPLVWYINWRIRQVREEVCDDISVKRLESGRKGYTQSILRVVEETFKEPKLGFIGIGLSERKNNIRERIKRIMSKNYKYHRPLTLPSIIILVVIIAISILISCEKSSETIQGEEPTAKNTLQNQEATTEEEQAASYEYKKGYDVFRKALDMNDLNLYRQSVEMFNKVVKEYPNTESEIGSYANLGICYEKLEEWHKALDAFDHIIKKFDHIIKKSEHGGMVPPEALKFAQKHKKFILGRIDTIFPVEDNPLLVKTVNDPRVYSWIEKKIGKDNEVVTRMVNGIKIGGEGDVKAGTDRVLLNEKYLIRGTDYTINYKSGTIELLNEKALDPNADLIVKYETTGISN